MKKITALAAALLLALGAAGCGTAAPEEPAGPAQPSAPVIDYNETDPSGWSFRPEASDPVTQALSAIDGVPYGTAGAALMRVIAGVNFAQLSAREDVLPAALAYLDGMTPLQLDYFSFQWQEARQTASGILREFPDNRELLSDAGFPDFDPAPYTEEAFDALEDMLREELLSRGVTDVWRSFSGDFPFFGA